GAVPPPRPGGRRPCRAPTPAPGRGAPWFGSVGALGGVLGGVLNDPGEQTRRSHGGPTASWSENGHVTRGVGTDAARPAPATHRRGQDVAESPGTNPLHRRSGTFLPNPPRRSPRIHSHRSTKEQEAHVGRSPRSPARGSEHRQQQAVLLLRTRTEDPTLGGVDRKVVDAGLTPGHQPVLGELPQLVAVAAPPLSRVIAAFVLEPYGDAISPEPPQLLPERVIKFTFPLLGQ